MLHLEDRHLAFDYAWVGSVGSCWEEFVEDFLGDGFVGVGEGVRGKHESSDCVVHTEVSVDLLGDAIGQFGSQYYSGSTLVGFEFVERGLDLPSLRVQAS